MSLPAILLFCMYLFWFFFLAGIAPGGAVDRPVWKLASYMEEPFRTTSEAGTSRAAKDDDDDNRPRQPSETGFRGKLQTRMVLGVPHGLPPRNSPTPKRDTPPAYTRGSLHLMAARTMRPCGRDPSFFSFIPRNATRCPLNPLSYVPRPPYPTLSHFSCSHSSSDTEVAHACASDASDKCSRWFAEKQTPAKS